MVVITNASGRMSSAVIQVGRLFAIAVNALGHRVSVHCNPDYRCMSFIIGGDLLGAVRYGVDVIPVRCRPASRPRAAELRMDPRLLCGGNVDLTIILSFWTSDEEMRFSSERTSGGWSHELVRLVPTTHVHCGIAGLQQNSGRQVASLSHVAIGGNLPVARELLQAGS